MQLNALFCYLWHNDEASCHKHFVVFSHNQHRLLPATCHNLRDGGRGPPVTLLTTPGMLQRQQQALKPDRLRIAISAYPTCIRRPRWHGKTRMVWLPDGEKNLICLFVLTQLTNVTDTQTHTDNALRYRPCLCIASRGYRSTQ